MAKAEKKSESSARKNLVNALAAIGVGDVKSPKEMQMIQELHSALNPPRVRKTRKSKSSAPEAVSEVPTGVSAHIAAKKVATSLIAEAEASL